MSLPRIAARAFNEPLMYDAGKAAAFVEAFGERITGHALELDGVEPLDRVAFQDGRPSMGRLGDRLGRVYDKYEMLPFDVVDGGIAVIAIEGTLVHKGAFVGQTSGDTSYQGIQTQVSRAAKSDKVKAVVFEVDSFGGEVAGAFETADMIHALSQAKPTVAILTDFALSAGYLMASAARTIVMPEYGRAGSIGVIRMHVDYERKLENEGVKVTLISAGKHKAAGNAFERLPAELAARWQAEVEKARETFAAHVGRYRGKRMSAKQAMDTEADHFQGAESVRLGLADAISSGNDAFAAFVADIQRKVIP